MLKLDQLSQALWEAVIVSREPVWEAVAAPRPTIKPLGLARADRTEASQTVTASVMKIRSPQPAIRNWRNRCIGNDNSSLGGRIEKLRCVTFVCPLCYVYVTFMLHYCASI